MKKSEIKKFEKMGVKISQELPTFDVPIDLIEPNPDNPNEMDDDTFDRLVEEMEETGIIAAIQIAPAPGDRFQIIGGEHRWRGAKVLGRETIPCNILTDEQYMDEDLRGLLMVRLNVIQGKMNREKFVSLYERMAKVYGEEQLQALFGYTSTDAWKKLTKGVEDALRDTNIGGREGSSLASELKKKAGKIKTIDGLASVLSEILGENQGGLKHGFMVFTYGGKRHIHIAMTDELESAVDKLTGLCRDRGLDINDVLSGMIVSWIGDNFN